LEDGCDYGFVVTFGQRGRVTPTHDHPSHRPVADAISAVGDRIVNFDI
jgi:hypothetical protein